ncbi:hypothetical protein [Duganella rivi]|uniref:hypothetical protein n=1 Tax=Duganella rivi TaxID=2666083 RepID=UPI0015805D36|nr:hypothetical protein [Duganella rivi]
MQKEREDVFINCPFDTEFAGLNEAIVFAIYDCGFRPRSALESENGGESRFEKIKLLIRQCKFGVHDISRTQLDGINQLPRFNMPLELGVFIGAMSYGDKKVRDKSLLILDSEPYRYQKFLSDIAGQDIRAHNNCERTAIRYVRDWLHSERQGRGLLPGGAFIADRYVRFKRELPMLSAEVRCRVEELSYVDYNNLAFAWIESHPSDNSSEAK